MQTDQSNIPRKRARLSDDSAAQLKHAALKVQPLINAETSQDGVSTSIRAGSLPQATSLTQFNNLQLQALKSLLQLYKAEHEALLHGLKSKFNTFCAEKQINHASDNSQQQTNDQVSTQRQQEQADQQQQQQGTQDGNNEAAKDIQPTPQIINTNATHQRNSPPRQAPMPTNSMTSHECGAAVSLDLWGTASPSVSKTPQSKAAKPSETEAISLSQPVQVSTASNQDTITASDAPSIPAEHQAVQEPEASAPNNITDMQVDTQPADTQQVAQAPTLNTVDADPGSTQNKDHLAANTGKDIDMVERDAATHPVVNKDQEQIQTATQQEDTTRQPAAELAEADQADLTIYEALTYAELNARLEKTLASQPVVSQQAVSKPQEIDSSVTLAKPRFDGASVEQLLLLEVQASAATEQELDDCGALACLAGSKGRHLIKHNAVLIGRSTEAKGEVDIEVCEDQGPNSRISRRQAFLTLTANGSWQITNTGRQTLCVDGVLCEQFQSTTLPHLGMLEVADVQLLFMQNLAATERLLRRSARVSV